MLTYVISPKLLVSHIINDKLCHDDKAFNTELKRLREIGVFKFCQFHEVGIRNLCNYFTKISNLTRPIVRIELSETL